MAAAYGVKLDANGYVTGFQIVNGGSAATSGVTFIADSFKIVATGQAAQTLFSVANVNGAAQVSIKGTLIADGSVKTTAVSAEAITAFRSAVSYGSYTGSGVTMFSFTFSVPQGGPAMILFTARQSYFADPANCQFALYLDGGGLNTAIADSGAAMPQITLMGLTNLAAGTHTVTMVGTTTSGNIVEQHVAIIVGAR